MPESYAGNVDMCGYPGVRGRSVHCYVVPHLWGNIACAGVLGILERAGVPVRYVHSRGVQMETNDPCRLDVRFQMPHVL